MQKLIVFLFLLSSLNAYTQTGGEGVFNFLNFQSNARIGALGGYAIATPEADLGLAIQNPSLLNQEFSKQVSLNYVKYLADITAGNFAFAYYFDKNASKSKFRNALNQITIAAGIQYINYGNFAKTAPDGSYLGTFSAGDYNYYISASKKLSDKFQYGSTLKFIYSNLAAYSSLGVAADAGITYYSEDKLFTAAAVLSNIGTQITTYTKDNYEKIPYNLQLGFTKKFAHNPLRIGVVAHNLQNPGGLLYQINNRNNGNIDLETGEPILEKFNILNHVMSHLVFNTELVMGKSLRLRVGYNYLRRRELGIVDFAGSTGFSWGFGIKISKFYCSYGSANYHLGNSSNQFSIVTNLSDFTKNKASN